jgi:metal-dependent amidase/aminoacylase/carboxypeptidase family protein
MEGFKDELIKFRRHIHAHPELSFKEKETSQYICNILMNGRLNIQLVGQVLA